MIATLITLTLSLTVCFGGIIIWSVRQEGRINGHDRLFDEREKQADDRHEEMKDRLTRIETKLDALPGRLSSR